MNNLHREELIRQFTLQAVPFAQLQAHSTDTSLSLFLELGAIDRKHRILDAGCGPGLLVGYLAPHAAQITGTDVTPAMVAEARARTAGVENATIVEGDMMSLPFPDGAFDRVCTRFTFHHIPDVLGAFKELVRVTQPGGRIVLMDAAPSSETREAYDGVERIRDPSHVRALTLEELVGLGESFGLGAAAVQRFGLSTQLEKLLAASFPVADGAERLRTLFRETLGSGQTGFSVQENDGDLQLTFPIAALAWQR